MPLIGRESIPRIELPEEEVHVPSLGGGVLVRGMDVPQMLRFAAASRTARGPQAGETADQAEQRAGVELTSLLLSMTVLAGDGLPVYSAAEWQVFALRHADDVLRLFETSLRLSGQQSPDAEKKT